LILGEQQYFLWDTASQSTKWLLIQKIWGHDPLDPLATPMQWLQITVRHVVSYCVKRSTSESVAVLPQVRKIHYTEVWDC